MYGQCFIQSTLYAIVFVCTEQFHMLIEIDALATYKIQYKIMDTYKNEK